MILSHIFRCLNRRTVLQFKKCSTISCCNIGTRTKLEHRWLSKPRTAIQVYFSLSPFFWFAYWTKDLELDEPLSPTIQVALKDSRNISSLYSHQVTAINAIGHGKNVIVSTSTASGKSVIYQVPLLRFLEEDPEATAIFVYPTKVCAYAKLGLSIQQPMCRRWLRIKEGLWNSCYAHVPAFSTSR